MEAMYVMGCMLVFGICIYVDAEDKNKEDKIPWYGLLILTGLSWITIGVFLGSYLDDFSKKKG